MRKYLIWAGVILGATLLSKPALANFNASEFGIWYPLVDNDLLKKLDQLRTEWGHPISVSPVDGAIGRADDSASQHNVINNGGKINAIDVFPSFNGRAIHPDDLATFYDLAKTIGFTGIGVYRDTVFKGVPWSMFHLDVRDSGFANWGRVAGNYTDLQGAMYL